MHRFNAKFPSTDTQITGLGNGANTATIPSWVAESSKAHNRGFLICVEASTVAVGTVIAYWIDFGLSYIDVSILIFGPFEIASDIRSPPSRGDSPRPSKSSSPSSSLPESLSCPSRPDGSSSTVTMSRVSESSLLLRPRRSMTPTRSPRRTRSPTPSPLKLRPRLAPRLF